MSSEPVDVSESAKNPSFIKRDLLAKQSQSIWSVHSHYALIEYFFRPISTCYRDTTITRCQNRFYVAACSDLAS